VVIQNLGRSQARFSSKLYTAEDGDLVIENYRVSVQKPCDVASIWLVLVTVYLSNRLSGLCALSNVFRKENFSTRCLFTVRRRVRLKELESVSEVLASCFEQNLALPQA